jgi:hypothetical protein
MLRSDAPLPADAAVDRKVSTRALQIDCARRDAGGRVTHVGGRGADGKRWLLELAAVIDSAQHGDARYYVARGAQQLGLTVADGELVTMTEDGWSVYSLPVCPG